MEAVREVIRGSQRDVHEISTFKNDGDGRFATLVCALRRGANRLVGGSMHPEGNPTAR